jgi:hypothetical protein
VLQVVAERIQAGDKRRPRRDAELLQLRGRRPKPRWHRRDGHRLRVRRGRSVQRRNRLNRRQRDELRCRCLHRRRAVDAVLARCEALAPRGVVAKRRSSTSQSNRSNSWLTMCRAPRSGRRRRSSVATPFPVGVVVDVSWVQCVVDGGGCSLVRVGQVRGRRCLSACAPWRGCDRLACELVDGGQLRWAS